jgi:hypothetical protein
MEIAFILFGALLVASGKTGLKRGRGGKMTRNGLITWLLGWFLVFAGLNALLGMTGITILGVAMIAFWIGRDTGFNRRAMDWAKSRLSGK